MTSASDWARAFAAQADADFRAWELYEKHPEALAAECHKLLYLQMACEKLCKCHQIRSGTDPQTVVTTHRVIENNLPIIVRQEMIDRNLGTKTIVSHMRSVRHLAREIELLSPAVKRGGHRPDNCEYPWQAAGQIVSPLSWSFPALQLCIVPVGRTFLKLLRCAIDRNLA